MDPIQTVNQQILPGQPQPVVPQVQPAQQPQQVQPQQPNQVQPTQPVPQAQPPAVQTPETTPVPTGNRTQEQFNKLLESNRKLNEMNENLRTQVQQPQPTPQPQQQVDINDFIVKDPVSGEKFVDDAKLAKRINELDDKARRAEDTVNRFIQTSEEREQRRQEQEAFQAHPELNPGGQGHDKRFSQQVRAAVLDSLAYPNDYGGRALSFKAAADFVKLGGTPQPQDGGEGQQQPAVPVGEQPQVPAQAPADQQPSGSDTKTQAATNFTGQPQNAQAPAVSQELARARKATQQGDTTAIIARLEGIDHSIPFNGAAGQEQ